MTPGVLGFVVFAVIALGAVAADEDHEQADEEGRLRGAAADPAEAARARARAARRAAVVIPVQTDEPASAGALRATATGDRPAGKPQRPDRAARPGRPRSRHSSRPVLRRRDAHHLAGVPLRHHAQAPRLPAASRARSSRGPAAARTPRRSRPAPPSRSGYGAPAAAASSSAGHRRAVPSSAPGGSSGSRVQRRKTGPVLTAPVAVASRTAPPPRRTAPAPAGSRPLPASITASSRHVHASPCATPMRRKSRGRPRGAGGRSRSCAGCRSGPRAGRGSPAPSGAGRTPARRRPASGRTSCASAPACAPPASMSPFSSSAWPR